MNKSELIEALAPRLGGRTQAAAAVEAMVDVVLREVAAGRSVGITGFGTFEKVERAPRTGRNPRTGEPVPIAGTSSPRFRPGAYFKDVVADPSALPAQGLAGARVSSDGRLERAGAPSSVRRAAGTTPGTGQGVAPDRAQGEDPNGRQERATGAGAGDGPTEGPRRNGSRRVTGTPDSVRKDAHGGEGGRTAPAGSPMPAPATGRIMASGQDITLGMISAKKAQLVRVKNDELAAKRKKDQDGRKDSGTKDSGTKGSRKRGSGKKASGKKGKKSTKGTKGAGPTVAGQPSPSKGKAKGKGKGKGKAKNGKEKAI